MSTTHPVTTSDAPRIAQALRTSAARLQAKADLNSQTGAQDMLDAASILEGLSAGGIAVQTAAPAPTNLSERGAQAWLQCKAVAHMARALAEVHEDRALILGHSENFTDEIGESSAALMEWLGDQLSNMDAMEGEADAWLDPVFEAAQATWPVAPPQEPTQPPEAVSLAERDVLAERRRQIVDLGRTSAHDDQNAVGELALAAACYAENAARQLDPSLTEPPRKNADVPLLWPDAWLHTYWKPKTARADLVRAGALILAEIDREDRRATDALVA